MKYHIALRLPAFPQMRRVLFLFGLYFSLFTVHFLLFPVAAQGQDVVFSTDAKELTRTVSTLLKSAQRPEVDETAKAWVKAVEGGKYEQSHLEAVAATATKMQTLKMRPYPTFDAFIRATNACMNDDESKARFQDWMKLVDAILDGTSRTKVTELNTFYDFSADLFARNMLRYAGKPGPNWHLEPHTPYQFALIEGQPAVVIEKGVSLAGLRFEKDSVVINNTSGAYLPLQYLWHGTRGSVDWGRTSLGKGIYCVFEKYDIDTRKSSYRIDSASMSYSAYFPKPIRGLFQDNISTNVKPSTAEYPRFESYQNIWKIDNLSPNLRYTGGFKLYGVDFIGQGSRNERAVVDMVSQTGKLLARAKAEKFNILRGEKVISEEAEVSLYFDQDSIYHPDILMDFNMPKHTLALERGKRSSSQASFFDSFHRCDLNVDDIQWDVNTPTINIGKKPVTFGSGSKNSAVFESNDFFSEKEYVKYQNVATYSPLASLARLSDSTHREVEADAFAKSLDSHLDASNVLGLLQMLSEGGFVYYDDAKKLITVKDKVWHYADAYVQRKDFDVMRISSQYNGVNGKMDIVDKRVAIAGVDNMMISDSQMVALKPYRGNVTLKRDRDMDFSGELYGGYGKFLGRNYHFTYGDFKVKMDSVDIFNLRIPTGNYDAYGNPLIVPLRTNIENARGVLSLSQPDDKSGTKHRREEKLARKQGRVLMVRDSTGKFVPAPTVLAKPKEAYRSAYPIFDSQDFSYAYYDQKTNQNGAYKRDSFYFKLEPFVFDSLHTFDPNGIKFEGKMVTNIFPEFQEPLRVQPDTSLGFTHQLPPEGAPVYGGLANYVGTLSLNNTGLKGKGTLKYLTSTFQSDSITFRPKTMSAKAKRFDVEEQRGAAVDFPKVEGVNVAIEWKPYEDDMEVSSKDSPFKFYGQDYNLRGKLHLRTKGLNGEGDFDWAQGIVHSRNYKFGPNYLKSDTTDVGIKSSDVTKLAFKSRGMKVNFDFDAQKGKMTANAKNAISEMPYNQFVTTFDDFDWDMKAKRLDFRSLSGRACKFVSAARGQDSLTFKGTSGTYDLEQFRVTVDGVEFVNVADAQIFPKDKKIVILKDAVIEPLQDAQIIADTINRYHVINRATVNIKGRKEYNASGYYEYNVGSQKQEILFSNIVTAQRGKNYVTKAEGTVKDKDEFLVDQKLSFRGNILLNANDKNLTFSGYCRMNSEKLKRSTWFSINSPIDRKNVVISYDKPVDPANDRVFSEIRMRNDSAGLYPLLLRTPRNIADRPFYSTKGALRFLEKPNEFWFGDSVRVAHADSLRGNLMTFSDKTGGFTAEGTFRFGDLIKVARPDICGIAKGTIGSANIEFNMLAGLQLPIPAKSMSIFTDELSAAIDNADIEYQAPYLNRILPNFIHDDRRLAKSMESVALGQLDIPKELDYDFFLGKLPMKWDDERLAFISANDKIGITSAGDKPFNKMVKGYFEVRQIKAEDKTNDVVHLYLEPTPGNYYFFALEDGVVSVWSSNDNFNNSIASLKKKDRKVKLKGRGKGKIKEGAGELLIELAEPAKMNAFVEQMQYARNGGQAPPLSPSSKTQEITPEQDNIKTPTDSLAVPTPAPAPKPKKRRPTIDPPPAPAEQPTPQPEPTPVQPAPSPVEQPKAAPQPVPQPVEQPKAAPQPVPVPPKEGSSLEDPHR